MGSQGVEDIMKYMKESAFTCTEEWLEACLEWVLESFQNSPTTSSFLKKEIYGQWLDADLMEMKSSSLPPNLSQQRITILQGKFGLQVNSLQDIGESSYSQYNKLKKLENENTNVTAIDSNHITSPSQSKARRCLYLTLTDGSQKIFGMEYTSISALSLSFKPGFKVILTGPIECRLGVLLLCPSQITILGGEVEALVNENSVENILSRNLNRQTPKSDKSESQNQLQVTQDQAVRQAAVACSSSLQEQPNDFNDDEDGLLMEIDENLLLGQAKDSSSSKRAAQMQVDNLPTPTIKRSSVAVYPASPPRRRAGGAAMEYQSKLLNQPKSNSKRSQPPPQVEPYSFSHNFQTESQRNQQWNSATSSKRFQPPTKREEYFDYNEHTNLEYNSRGFKNTQTEFNKQTKISSYLKPIPKIQQSQALITKKQAEPINLDETEVIPLGDTQDNTNSVLEMCDDEPALVHSDFEPNSKSPFQYLQQIKDGAFRVGEVVRVKATISTLVSSLKIENGLWTILVNINDGSGYLVTRVSPQVLNGLVGFSPTEMKQMKMCKTPEAKSKVINGLKNLTSTLVHLNAILCIRVSQSDSESVITGIEEITEYHVTELRKRVSSDNRSSAT